MVVLSRLFKLKILLSKKCLLFLREYPIKSE